MDTTQIYELKITLLGTKPVVYRTLQIEASRTMYELHIAIQIAFGWEDYHLHLFNVGEMNIGMSEFDEFDDDDTIEEKTVRLFQLKLEKKDQFIYLYDFGDNWEHQITITKIIEPKNTFYPKCIRGGRNSPPEDCGGIYGFEEFKEIMGDRKHPEFKNMKTWYGGMYDEEYFSIQEVNSDFKQFDALVFERSQYAEE